MPPSVRPSTRFKQSPVSSRITSPGSYDPQPARFCLAFNVNGEPFEVPAAAIGWRVKRLKAKGAPEVVYGRDGLPLVLPVDSDLDDLRAEVGTPGRYQLDPVDEANKPVPNGTPGYVFVHADVRPVDGGASSGTRPTTSPSDSIVIEAMRMNAEMARTIIDRFPQMLESASPRDCHT